MAKHILLKTKKCQKGFEMSVQEIFKNKRVDFAKLLKFGFVKNEDKYEYKTEILEGEFELFVNISQDGKVSTKLFAKNTDEEYVLHLVKDAVGEFVGNVRTEFENVLKKICEQCFEKDVFKSRQSKDVVKYIKNKYGDELEFLWEKFPNDAIWRRKDSKKWYGVLMIIPKNKLGLKGDEPIEVIDVHVKIENIQNLVDNQNLFEGYHMNKKHWLTIWLNGKVENEKVFKLIDESFLLAK